MRASRIKLGDGTTLASMLTMSGDDFYADLEVQRSYDLAWALFLFLDSEESATKDFTLIRESAEKLDAAKHLPEFADLETRLSAFLLYASGPDQDTEDVLINKLAAQVTKSETLTQYRASGFRHTRNTSQSSRQHPTRLMSWLTSQTYFRPPMTGMYFRRYIIELCRRKTEVHKR